MMDNKNQVIDKINNLEKIFSVNKYNGKEGKEFFIKKGTIPIMISAPHAVNHKREGRMKDADLFTGSISLYLQELTNCHLICATNLTHSDPNYSPEDYSSYKKELRKYIEANDIKLLIDFHGCDKYKECSVELGTIDNDLSSLNNYIFIKDLFVCTFELFLKNHEKNKVFINQQFKASNENTITNYIHRLCNIPTIQIEVNNLLRNLYEKDNEEGTYNFIRAFIYIIETLKKVDWRANSFKLLKTNQAKRHKPQDVAYVSYNNLSRSLNIDNINDILSAYNFGLANKEGQIELIHLDNSELDKDGDKLKTDDEILLTNRLIFGIFGRDWIDREVLGEESKLLGLPIVLHLYKKINIGIGMPKANKIADISFSQALYDRVKDLSDDFDFYVYNKYVDVKIPIDFTKAYYGDLGRVNKNNIPVERIMMPRFYKLLLAYLNYPFKNIRREEYLILFEKLDKDAKKIFSENYKKMPGENFYSLIEAEEIREKDLLKIIDIQMNIVANKTELLIFPKRKYKDSNKVSYKTHFKSLKAKLLKFYVGCSFFLLRSSWAMETDDRHGIVRVSPNIMKLLGVEDNDKIDINYGAEKVIARVLSDESCEDFIIEIPATIRLKLGMNSIGDIVKVNRNMEYNFKRHSIEQAITFLGTLLTVITLNCSILIKFLIMFVVFPLMMWWILNEERIKVK